ncbi:hypothetical protein DFH94DRAFT_761748 [Russula ochroleuca]|jgi:hypothetical protein|uniref:DUF6699 domain-containing protein n=1 Tax=Russula ochroleuca TaxID=152965 RepID=A0A9P5K0F6_9AGAM|nr:hypothetical protein DFH94DRAFT_761748 [Russula ochroleuca]
MTQSLDHDYGLPKEELTSPAVHPPILSLKLESHQGYPQAISIETSGDSGGVGVTVQDVLRTILKDLRIPIPTQELSKLGDRELAEIDAAFGERCKSEEELSEGPRRIDYLCGRDRLRILPKLSPDGSVLLPTSTPTPA